LFFVNQTPLKTAAHRVRKGAPARFVPLRSGIDSAVLLRDPLSTLSASPNLLDHSGGSSVPEDYSVRNARPEEQRQLTRLCVRATLHAGYDEASIDRVMPGLTITLPLIAGDYVRVAQDTSGDLVGVVAVTNTALQGIALLYGIYVDPARWKCGIGRLLFAAAVARARELKAGALMIYAEPSAEGFYKQVGAIRIGEGPFFYSPEIILPHFLYLVHQEE
jgi:GNAT superfamily N-acetyltransferase